MSAVRSKALSGALVAVAGVAAALAMGRVAAQASLPTPPALTLASALSIAWQQNPRVLEAQRVFEAAGYAVTGAYGGFLPSAGLNMANGNHDIRSIQGSLNLWRGGSDIAGVKAANARERNAQSSLTKVQLTVGNETVLAFHGLVQAQAQLEQWQKYLGSLARLRATIENRSEAGVAPRADVETAISRIRQAEVGQEAAALAVQSNRDELARLLASEPVRALPEGDPAPAIVALGTRPLATQVDAHPDVAIAQAQVDEQSAVSDQAVAALSPEVAVQYRHYYEGERFANDAEADTPVLVAGYPIGGLFSTFQKARAERAKLEGTRAKLASARRDVEAQLKVVREQVTSFGKQYVLQQQASASSQALVESFLRQYQVGRRSWVEVLNAQREAHEVELALIASRRSWLVAGDQLALQTLAWDLLLAQRPAAQRP